MAPTKINSAEEAIAAVAKISNANTDATTKGDLAFAVAYFIKEKGFRTVVGKEAEAAVRDYWAGLHNPGAGNIVSFQNTEPFSAPKERIKAWFVPLVSIDRLIANGNKVPTASLAVVDLARSNEPPFICTMKLTGCCFVLGWDASNGRLYLAHIEPSERHDRTFIARFVREQEIFPVEKRHLAKYIAFGGDDQQLPSGYNNYTVNIVGFILPPTQISMVFRFEYRNEQGSFMEDFRKS